MRDDGGNAGVSGILDLAASGVKFTVWARGFDADLNAGLLDAAGRGDTEWPEQRPTSSNGIVAVSGVLPPDGFPIPSKYRGEIGTLKLTHDAADGDNAEVYQSYPVRVVGSTFKRSEKTAGEILFTHLCKIVSDPTMSGYGGTQATAATETFSDKILWAVLSTLTDPNGIQGSATRRLLMWGIGDNDAAEKTKADSVLAAIVAPYSGLKVRTGNFTRLSKNAALIDATFGLTDTKDDVQMPGSGINDDPTDLEDGTEICLVQSSGTPSAPGTPSGLKLVNTATKQLNDGKWAHTFRYGRRDNKDAIEQEGTYEDIDVSDLTSEGRQTTVYTTASGVPADPSPPSGLQIVSSRITVRNNVKSIKVWMFAKDTPEQKAIQEASYTDVDPQGMQSKTAVADVDATPSTPAGLVLRSTRTKNLTNDHVLNIKEAGETDTRDDWAFPKTKVSTDVSTLDQEDVAVVFYVPPASPVAPTPRSGMVIADYIDVPVTNASASKITARIYRMAYVSNSQRHTLPRYENVTDPNDLDTRKTSAVIWDTGGSAPADPSLPSGLKLLDKADVALPGTSVYQLRIYRWAKKDSADEVTMQHTTYEATSFLGAKAVNASIINTTDVPSTTGAANFAALKDQVTFERIFCIKLNADETLQIITTAVAYKIVEGRSSFERVSAPAYCDGSDVYVFMRQKVKIGTNLWQYELAEQYLPCTRINFTIARRVSGSTLPYHTELAETTNNATFLGIAAGFAAFTGVNRSATNLAVSADRVSDIAWDFVYQSIGIIDMADASIGWNWTTTDLTSVGPGWVKASDVGFSSSLQASGDYSVFLA